MFRHSLSIEWTIAIWVLPSSRLVSRPWDSGWRDMRIRFQLCDPAGIGTSKLRVQISQQPYRNMPIGTIQFNLCSNIRLYSHCWNDSTACRVSRVPVSTVSTVYYYSILLFLAFDSVAYTLLSLVIRTPLTQHCVFYSFFRCI